MIDSKSTVPRSIAKAEPYYTMNESKAAGMGWRSQSVLIDAYNFAFHSGPMPGALPKAGVLFSALGVEAFLNDLTAHLNLSGSPSYNCERVSALGDILAHLEEERTQLKTKVQFCYFILSGTRITKGEEPYRSFSLLVDLRNRIAHGRPPVMRFVNRTARSMPKDEAFVKKLVAAGAGAESFAHGPDWEAIAWHQPCAQWAYRSASAIIKHLISAVPSPTLQQNLKFFMRDLY